MKSKFQLFICFKLERKEFFFHKLRERNESDKIKHLGVKIAWTFSSGWKSNPVCNLSCVDCWIQFDNIACVLTCRILFRTGYRDHFCFLYIYNQPGKRMYCYSNPQKINMLRKRTCISRYIHQVNQNNEPYIFKIN